MSRIVALVAVLGLVVPSLAADPPKPSPLVGIWEGPLKAGAIELRLVFRVKADDKGQLKATLDSIDQGAYGIPIEEITLTDRDVKLVLPLLKAKFTGTLSADEQSIEGNWEQAGKLPLTVKKVEKASTINRPQMPKKPYPYLSEDVTFENAPAKLKLAGTLTLPKGDGPFPAVVLISGSGPQDRDETLMGHKPFLVLADHLSRNGFAVLRYDDRGVGKSTGKHDGATSADFATDAYAAIKFLQTRKEIDPKQIGLMGHSEGGLIAPIVAVAHPADVGFLVLLAGPGVPGDEILLAQTELIQKAMKAPAETVGVRKKILRALITAAKSEGSVEERKKKMTAAAEAEYQKLPEADRKRLDADVEKADKTVGEAVLTQFSDPWFHYFFTYDPRPTLKQVKCPVLALNGELDLQVPAKENLEAITTAMRSGGKTPLTTKLLPGLNHLFQPSKTGSPAEYGQIEQTIAPEALEVITEWLKKRPSM